MPENFAGTDDIIVALATPPGSGAISVIRVSGKNCLLLIEKFFKSKTNTYQFKSHTIHYGKIYNSSNEIIDDVLISIFKNPNSYTGEDSFEISFHCNYLISQKIFEVLFSLGIRSALPGEFTKRAFLNGKIDLSQAEAVADIINARSENSLKGARNQLNGLLSQKISYFRNELINAASLIELGLDFAEEDIEFIDNTQIIELVNKVRNEINKLIETYRFGKIIKEGINICLVGDTNVGKSSLLNYLLKESRAIVSPIPGTTRDIIREEMSIDGILFRFYDTAGIRNTEDTVELEGVSRSRETIKNSDIVIFLFDITKGIDNSLLAEIKSYTEEKRIIITGNKADLGNIKDYSNFISISAKTGIGINNLLDLIKEKTIKSELYTESDIIITNLRHKEALMKCNTHLINAIESINNLMTNEFISIDIRSAIDSLSEIIGLITTDNILDNIFSNFCIGK